MISAGTDSGDTRRRHFSADHVLKIAVVLASRLVDLPTSLALPLRARARVNVNNVSPAPMHEKLVFRKSAFGMNLPDELSLRFIGKRARTPHTSSRKTVVESGCLAVPPTAILIIRMGSKTTSSRPECPLWSALIRLRPRTTNLIRVHRRVDVVLSENAPKVSL